MSNERQQSQVTGGQTKRRSVLAGLGAIGTIALTGRAGGTNTQADIELQEGELKNSDTLGGRSYAMEQAITGINQAERDGMIEFGKKDGEMYVEAAVEASPQACPVEVDVECGGGGPCGTTGLSYDASWTSQSITLQMDKELTESVAYAITMGGGVSTAIGILAQAGIITSIPGWVAGLIGVALVMAGETLNYNNKGCGVEIEAKQYHAPIPTQVNVDAQ